MQRILVILAAGLALTGSPLLAQGGAPGSVAVLIRGGYRVATQDLGRTGVLEGAGYVAFDRLDPAPTLGVGIEAPLFGPVAARVLAEYAFEADAVGQWFCDAFSPCPSVLTRVNGRVQRWSALADLRFQPSWGLGPLRPIAFLGVGRREYRLRWNSPVQEVPIPTAFDRAIWFAHTGVGAELSYGAWALLAEADATIGRFGADAPTFVEGTSPADGRGAAISQVDVGVSVGVRFGIH